VNRPGELKSYSSADPVARFPLKGKTNTGQQTGPSAIRKKKQVDGKKKRHLRRPSREKKPATLKFNPRGRMCGSSPRSRSATTHPTGDRVAPGTARPLEAKKERWTGTVNGYSKKERRRRRRNSRGRPDKNVFERPRFVVLEARDVCFPGPAGRRLTGPCTATSRSCTACVVGESLQASEKEMRGKPRPGCPGTTGRPLKNAVESKLMSFAPRVPAQESAS